MPVMACTSSVHRRKDSIWAIRRSITNALMPSPYCNGPGIFSGKRPLVRASHSGQSLISATTFNFLTLYLISNRTRSSRADGSISERSMPQLLQTSTMETSSTVTVSKFSPSLNSLPCSCHGSFAGIFLVSSLPVCDGGMLEFLLVFLVVFSRKTADRIVTRSHKPVRTLSVFSVISPSFRSEAMSAL